MGWASGFRAGADMAQTAMDAYEKAKKQREMRELEQGLQNQQAGQQAALPAYEAEQQRLAGMTQPQFAAQQVGLGPAPMGSAQMSPVTAPPSAPMQPGLVDPQRAAAGIGLPGQMAPEPGAYSPVSGQALGMGAAPQGQMSILETEMERANQLRALGYTEEADKAYTRALALREEERAIEQAAFDRGITTREQARKESDTEATVGLRGAQSSLVKNQAEALGFEITDEKSYRALDSSVRDYVGRGGNVNDLPQQDFFKNAPLKDQEAYLANAFNVNKVQYDLQSQSILNKLQGVDTLDGMAQVFSDEKRLTPDTSYYVSRANEDGRYGLYSMPDSGGDAEILIEGDANQLRSWMLERATNPAVAFASAYEAKKDYATLMNDMANKDFEQRIQAADTLVSMFEDDYGSVVDEEWKSLDFAGKLEFIRMFMADELPSP